MLNDYGAAGIRFFWCIMAKNRLEVSYDFAFHLVALSTGVKAYKLAWTLNRDLQINLSKADNLSINFSRGKSLSIANYTSKREHQTVRLLKNRSEDFDSKRNTCLLPELTKFEYLLMVSDDSTTFDINTFISKIEQIPFVDFALSVDTAKLKSKDNLIF